MTAKISIPLSQDRIGEFCERHGVRKMWLYGSALTDKFRPDSDVDVLIEFQEDRHPGWEFFSWHEELEPVWGHKVDLHTPEDFRPSRRAEILLQARVVYER